MKMGKHRMAIVGLGGMGSWHARNILEKLPELEVYGAYDIRPEAMESAKEMGLYAYASLDEMLNDPSIELVTIAVPNNFHKDIAIAALRAGKNVVCEKPVTLNAGIRKLFKVNGVFLSPQEYKMLEDYQGNAYEFIKNKIDNFQ